MNRSGVQLGIHPLDGKVRRVPPQFVGRQEPQPRLQQCHGLDEHVVMCEQILAALEDGLERPDGDGVIRVGRVGPRVDRGRIEKDHLSNAAARAAS